MFFVYSRKTGKIVGIFSETVFIVVTLLGIEVIFLLGCKIYFDKKKKKEKVNIPPTVEAPVRSPVGDTPPRGGNLKSTDVSILTDEEAGFLHLVFEKCILPGGILKLTDSRIVNYLIDRFGNEKAKNLVLVISRDAFCYILSSYNLLDLQTFSLFAGYTLWVKGLFGQPTEDFLVKINPRMTLFQIGFGLLATSPVLFYGWLGVTGTSLGSGLLSIISQFVVTGASFVGASGLLFLDRVNFLPAFEVLAGFQTLHQYQIEKVLADKLEGPVVLIANAVVDDPKYLASLAKVRKKLNECVLSLQQIFNKKCNQAQPVVTRKPNTKYLKPEQAVTMQDLTNLPAIGDYQYGDIKQIEAVAESSSNDGICTIDNSPGWQQNSQARNQDSNQNSIEPVTELVNFLKVKQNFYLDYNLDFVKLEKLNLNRLNLSEFETTLIQELLSLIKKFFLKLNQQYVLDNEINLNHWSLIHQLEMCLLDDCCTVLNKLLELINQEPTDLNQIELKQLLKNDSQRLREMLLNYLKYIEKYSVLVGPRLVIPSDNLRPSRSLSFTNSNDLRSKLNEKRQNPFLDFENKREVKVTKSPLFKDYSKLEQSEKVCFSNIEIEKDPLHYIDEEDVFDVSNSNTLNMLFDPTVLTSENEPDKIIKESFPSEPIDLELNPEIQISISEWKPDSVDPCEG
jgi:hypothetical protein